jgi:hypothetical protein
VSLGVGKRLTSPTVPMILAASIGLMAKIWVRVVPERSSPVASSSATTANDALWGSTPMSTFMRAYLRFGRTSQPSTRAKDISTSWRAHTSFEVRGSR